MVYLFNKFIELGLLLFGLSTIWEETDGFAKKTRCDLENYLMTVL